MTEEASQNELSREVGLVGAVMMGLGSIIGTGVFVSLGIVAGLTGPSVVLAIIVAAFVATFNGLSSAQLAANYPVSGGTYEYGYRWLHPTLGFTAGWMFLCAKSASAATAALGFSGYALNLFNQNQATWTVPLAVGIVVFMTMLVLSGIRRSNWTNIAIVSLTLASLAGFVLAGLPTAFSNGTGNLSPFFQLRESGEVFSGFFEACALMFVAYTGYGRIATLGEEVVNPHRTIPRAIICTLIVTSLLYAVVGLVGIASSGSQFFAQATDENAASLVLVARQFDSPFVEKLIAVGAVTAMLGVLLNLILGLSRVALAMGRRGDLPRSLGRLNKSESTPTVAVIAVGIVIALLSCIGDVKTTWSFSAFTVLVYYALTNLAAIQLSDEERLFPKIIPWLGLISCLSLAFWVEPRIWMSGLALIAGGLVFQLFMRQMNRQHS
ncbi:putative amino acid permease YhdG [Thalassoglobus neptunius]|uniref:Putative amino acid permease YhdG n=1 Tax=Thalassoglobus neptunius TaxID=1938619 RepID=A0A5C5VR49_9PLAN|nr:APC family permease [Thalassoglobus neptunius]TWT40032.1 putative amino acid permease YhdG [Thalassoglobus neptunius]